MIRVGLVGFGLAGATFHAPLIRACARMELCAIMTSRDVPRAVATMPELLEACELVVVASPNATHFNIARQALDAGKHVVVDKPFTATLDQADDLIALANTKGRKLTVFHNRRWDGDYMTVRATIGRLGRLQLYQAHWDRFRPNARSGWKEVPDGSTGILNDLGPHLIDQALQLFGVPDTVYCDIAAQRQGSQIDDYFELTLEYGSMRAVLGCSVMVAAPRPRFALHGDAGSFVKHGLDPQEEALKRGADPLDLDFGVDRNEGQLTHAGGTELVRSARGRYLDFYEGVADALRNGAPMPVDPGDAREVMHIIALARQSAAEGRRLPV